ncbi:cell envelope integrity protein CreD [Cryomorphaceae bacterium 1068]|nr:cell envelope integrity protein CreD [Cryomorphaceae bacterium 1068]
MTTENTNNNNTNIDRVGNMIKGSITVKLIVVTVLMLLLLIPTSMVKSIIQERERLNQTATNEVSAIWAKQQRVEGPVLTIPLIYAQKIGKDTAETTKYWHILPEELRINGDVSPETLKRGIYEVVVYKSALELSGRFDLGSKPDPNHLKEIQYDKAFLTVGINDLRGVKNDIKVNWNGRKLDTDPGSKVSEMTNSGITVYLPEINKEEQKSYDFDFDLALQGSGNLSFVPLGSRTEVQVSSPWSAPSFQGSFLPTTREVTDDGFEASWTVLELNRNFPQSWIGSGNFGLFNESAFGVDFILPLDDYQKSFRSAKYAVLVISLTFLLFFLVEVTNKQRIHPFQYALVGLALCLFYVLLVSISEHIDFNLAYGISTIGIVGMISLYSISVFKKIKLSAVLFTILTALYGFLFVTLQLSDYALLLGSIGLSVILGLTMYFTRNINWYQRTVATK